MKLIELFERTLTVDTSFVQKTLFDNYDDIIEAQTPQAFLAVMDKAFEPYNIVFELGDKQGEFGVIDATYLARETMKGRIRVKISPSFASFLEDDQTRKLAVVSLSSLIRHELVHREQAKRSQNWAMHQHMPQRVQNYPDEDVQYLADPHETYAMAHEVIEQCEAKGMSREEIIADLRNARPLRIIRGSSRFRNMYQTLQQDDPFKVLLRLRKTIAQIVGQR